MRLYQFLAARPLPKTFMGKIMLVSFVGVHIPIFGAVAFVLVYTGEEISQQLPILAAMLVATLAGTIATMFAMSALMAPIRTATNALETFLRHREIPSLPVRYTDEAGILLRGVQESITRLDNALTTARLQNDGVDQSGKFQVISGLSHDIRTPLNHILGFAQLLRAEAIGPLGTENYSELADMVSQSGEDLVSLLQTVLDLSAAEAEQPEDGALDQLDAAALLRDTVALEHLHAELRGVHMTLDAPETAVFMGRTESLRQAVSCMLQIAIETSAAEEAPGPIAVRLDEDLSGRFVVSVHDGGRALAAGDIPPELEGLAVSASGGAIAPEGVRSASPIALRLSLVHTLARVMGGTLELRTGADGQKEQRLTLDRARPAATAGQTRAAAA
ncbi:signal transduction histidine kinase [Palleronia aestuarii]|uniref:histidine kinase n=1 Tax=Palleronia aestuarii TaxID=568105 RepID=A0A2W7NWX6_9RHOB|nr:HAMP domain-containing sensor histidine kinase [Palleronia aestuarii]PZX15742.1 signal transduction histidine kinase [Palleronia aestuarii]